MMKTRRLATPRRFFIIFFFLIAFTSSARAADIASGLIGHWKLDGNGQDASGNGNHGTVHGAASTTNRFLTGNGAMNFNGTSDYIDMGKQFLSGSDDFTVSAWVKSAGAQNTYSVPVSQGHDLSFNGFAFQYGYPISNSVGLIFGSGSGWKSAPFNYSAATDTAWHHLAATKSGTTFTTYKDGVFQASTTSSIVYGSINFNIGRDTFNTDSNHRTWNGSIDDVRVYNRALAADDIQVLYSNGGPATFRNAVIRNGILR